MFNVVIDPPPHRYWNDKMSSPFPPAHHGCEGRVCVRVLICFVSSWQKSWTPCLNHQRTRHIHSSSGSTPPPHPTASRSASWLWCNTARLTPLLCLSAFTLIYLCFILIKSSIKLLHHLLILLRIDTAVLWLSAHSEHLLVCVSRLLCGPPHQPTWSVSFVSMCLCLSGMRKWKTGRHLFML